MWEVYGQDHVLRQLEASLKHGQTAHAYLLVGPPHVGKMTLALNLAQGVNCLKGPGEPCGECVQCTRIARGLHADLRVVGLGRGEEGGPTRTVIRIDDVREVLRQVNLKPYEGACTVIIFDRADLLSEEAANALLKTLEEPPPQVLILLLTADEEGILPTVRSRCRRLVLLPVPKEKMVEALVKEHHTGPEEAERLSRLARGCPGWAINALAEGVAIDAQANTLWLAAERQGRGLVKLQRQGDKWVCPLAGCVLLAERRFLPTEPFGPGILNREVMPVDFSDLAYWKGWLWSLERNAHQLCRRNALSGQRERCWSFAQSVLVEPYFYPDAPFGLAEALLISEEGIVIGLDNNNRLRPDGDARPWLFHFALPADWQEGVTP